MPLTLDQYATYLDTRQLPWPAPPQPDVPKDVDEPARDTTEEPETRTLDDGECLRRAEIGAAGIKSRTH